MTARKRRAKIRASDVVRAMEAIAPPALALDGDPVGLAVGDPGRPAARVLLALDATRKAVDEARRAGAGMLVAHHPRIYRPLATLRDDDPAGGRAAAVVRSGLAVYCAHTNLDMAPGGTNDRLAELVGIRDPEIVKPERSERLVKLVVFVPAAHVEKVRAAVCGAGAGAIGRYSDCTFRTPGTGTFRCGEGTRPFIGKPGGFEEVEECRLETVAGEYAVPRIVEAMLRAHPYEEAAYDLYPVMGRAAVYGFGRAGSLPKPEAVPTLAKRLAAAVGSNMVQYHGDAGTKVARVAAWAGGGVDAKAVLASGAEALVAGEVGFHDLETFAERNVAVITLGHGHSEEPALEPLAERLRLALPGLEVTVAKDAGYAFRNI